MKIITAISDLDIARCFDAMQELRPHLVREQFVELIKSMQLEGYELAGLEVDEEIVAVMGYRYLHFLHLGKHYYIDDLSTKASNRSHGYGKKLLHWLLEKAKDNGYQAIALDSSHHRYGAHKLSLNEGFNIIGHHFVKKL